MEELQFRIPKQTDENLIRALTTIKVEMARSLFTTYHGLD